MAVALEKVTEGGLNTLKNLFELAAYDLSEWSGANIGEGGQYLQDLDCKSWYENPDYRLFFIRVEGLLAGCIVIRYLNDENMYYLNHFFVLRKFRGKRIGKEAATMAFNLYEGKWRVSEFDWNVPAQLFWRKVIQGYTNDSFIESRRKDNKGPAQEFTNQKL
ncbi:GNAT family N-acetyltransferase [Paenibacillus rhizovicinus]|uniref:GNAT family N-acetyltransferase n=1 Tax=Paenibacillus rhizovicinus TaxID=2704463 RepID=A0A6C0P639_9BACL|nr:GNAT family N-acetyltransferase [Paenibacillus rhizovicinus]QHW34020.1 GNAT family N-acetyltransferase [Paenibacillus rhizovicinus]